MGFFGFFSLNLPKKYYPYKNIEIDAVCLNALHKQNLCEHVKSTALRADF